MNTILEVQGLTKEYKSADFCLNDVSFSIPSGTIMGFVGENGAGKSTTIGCILNTLIKDSGTIQVFGKEMTDDSIDIRDDIGVVYDTSAFPVYLTPAKYHPCGTFSRGGTMSCSGHICADLNCLRTKKSKPSPGA